MADSTKITGKPAPADFVAEQDASKDAARAPSAAVRSPEVTGGDTYVALEPSSSHHGAAQQRPGSGLLTRRSASTGIQIAYSITLEAPQLFGQVLNKAGRELTIESKGENLGSILELFGLAFSAPEPELPETSPNRISIFAQDDIDKLLAFLRSFVDGASVADAIIEKKISMRARATTEYTVLSVAAWPRKLQPGIIYIKTSESEFFEPHQIAFKWKSTSADEPLPFHVEDIGGTDYTDSFVVSNKQNSGFTFLYPVKVQDFLEALKDPDKILEFISRQDFNNLGDSKVAPFAGFEKSLRDFLKSADDKFTVKKVLYQFTPGQETGRIWLNFAFEGRLAGDLELHYDTDRSGKVSFHIGSFQLKDKGLIYGMEVIGNFLKFVRTLPGVSRINFQPQEQQRFIWRHIDGFQVDLSTLKFVRKKIKEWNQRFGWHLDLRDINSATTTHEISRLIDMGKTFPSLVAEAIQVHQESLRPLSQSVVRSRFPGEIALLGHEIRAHRRAYSVHVNPHDDAAYAAFLDSLILYWSDRASKIERADQIIKGLKAQRESIPVPSRTKLTLSPIWPGRSESFRISNRWPSFLGSEDLKNSIQTSDGHIKIGNILSQYNESSEGYNVVMDFVDANGAYVAAVTLDYIPDVDNPGQWHVKDSYVHIEPNHRSKKYGIELRTQIIRFHYGLPAITRWEFPLTDKALLLWRHVAGLSLEPYFLNLVKDTLVDLTREYNLGFKEEDIEKAQSTWDFAHLFQLNAPYEPLIQLAQEVWPGYLYLQPNERYEKTRNVGELALWIVAKVMEIKKEPLLASLDLSNGNPHYRKFLESLQDYWTYRQHLVDRGPQVLAGITQELQDFDQGPPVKPATKKSIHSRTIAPPPKVEFARRASDQPVAPTQAKDGGTDPVNLARTNLEQGLHDLFAPPLFDGSAALDLSAQIIVETDPAPIIIQAANDNEWRKPQFRIVPALAHNNEMSGNLLETPLINGPVNPALFQGVTFLKSMAGPSLVPGGIFR